MQRGSIMSDANKGADRSDTQTTRRKRAWSPPRIETIKGREAAGGAFSYGGPDGGFYS
jgi:hypothetical protein